MKKIILILLFTPLVSFGQIIEYLDILKIDSKEAFMKLMYELEFSADNTYPYYFGYDITENENGTKVSSHWARWFDDTKTFSFQIARQRNSGLIDDYTLIKRKIENRCTYVTMKIINNDNYACYQCSNAEFDGYIALGMTSNGAIVYSLRYSQIFN